MLLWRITFSHRQAEWMSFNRTTFCKGVLDIWCSEHSRSHMNKALTLKLPAWVSSEVLPHFKNPVIHLQGPAQSLQNQLHLTVFSWPTEGFVQSLSPSKGKIEALESVTGRGKKNPSPWQREPLNKRKHSLGMLAMPFPHHDEMYCTGKGADKWQKGVCACDWW